MIARHFFDADEIRNFGPNPALVSGFVVHEMHGDTFQKPAQPLGGDAVRADAKAGRNLADDIRALLRSYGLGDLDDYERHGGPKLIDVHVAGSKVLISHDGVPAAVLADGRIWRLVGEGQVI